MSLGNVNVKEPNVAADQSHRFREVKKVLWLILVLNYAVCAAKLIVGSLAQSASMVADGFHSLSDGSSNIVGLVGLRVASQPVDRDHPYGHGKFETLTALGIAAMLFFVAIEVAKTAYERWMNPTTPTVGVLQLAVMVVTMMINYGVTRYERAQGLKLHSEVLVSDAAHTMSDLYVSTSVLVGLIVVKLGFPKIDPLISLVVAGFIIKAGVEIVTESSRVLCDAAVLDPEEVIDEVTQIDCVTSCHKVRTRGRADQVFLDLHVQVDKPLDLVGVHDLTHEIDSRLRLRFDNLFDTAVHVEPAVKKR